jgi:hypothetical protein
VRDETGVDTPGKFGKEGNGEASLGGVGGSKRRKGEM